MIRSSAYNRFGVLMGTSERASGPRWPSWRDNSMPMITLISSQGDFCATASRGCHSASIKDDTGRPIELAVCHPFTGDSAINRVDRLDDEQIIFAECASMAQMVRPIIGIPTGSVKDHLVIGKNEDLENFSNV